MKHSTQIKTRKKFFGHFDDTKKKLKLYETLRSLKRD